MQLLPRGLFTADGHMLCQGKWHRQCASRIQLLAPTRRDPAKIGRVWTHAWRPAMQWAMYASIRCACGMPIDPFMLSEACMGRGDLLRTYSKHVSPTPMQSLTCRKNRSQTPLVGIIRYAPVSQFHAALKIVSRR
jgi:hypothetical protein